MSRAPFTWAGFRRGFRFGMAIAVPIFVYGLAFGLVAAQAGMGWGWATAFSAGVFSGSAQLATISVLQTGHATLTAVAATVLVMNARYLLFGATLQPWLSQAGPARALPSLLFLGDANWIGTMRAIDQGEDDRAYLAGTGVPPVVVWLAGTVIGAVFGSILPDPRALGADMMLPAFAAAMMAVMIHSRRSLVPVAVGATAALAVGHLAGQGWGIVAAGLAGAGIAALTAPTQRAADAG